MNRAEERIRIKTEWFPDHVANDYIQWSPDGSHKMEILPWHQPGTSNYAVEYWFSRDTLAVMGDIGEAVYQWHHSIGDLKDVAHVELDYFSSKCQASEDGRGYRSWNEEEAKRAIEYYLDSGNDDENAELRKRFSKEYGWEALQCHFDWNHWLGVSGRDIFGDICEMSDVGMKVDIRCHGHLIGLKMAAKQLRWVK